MIEKDPSNIEVGDIVESKPDLDISKNWRVGKTRNTSHNYKNPLGSDGLPLIKVVASKDDKSLATM